tara:strand:+ start:2319 stop:2624 length:306 start_codon:yes stop_codon:yes gene_type:complete
MTIKKSLFAIKNIKKGEKITIKNIGSVMSYNGMDTKYKENIIGEIALKNINKYTPLQPNLITCSTNKLRQAFEIWCEIQMSVSWEMKIQKDEEEFNKNSKV